MDRNIFPPYRPISLAFRLLRYITDKRRAGEIEPFYLIDLELTLLRFLKGDAVVPESLRSFAERAEQSQRGEAKP